ncbi:MAG: FAD-binding oxidoreductase [Cyanobacteria bacterium]|nr:FAD-binding oxidoreductase [Cyanobacteriota bacterium]
MATAAGDVLVIGGGLAGSLTALALRQQGLAVTVVAPAQQTIASFCSYGGVSGWPALPGSLGEAMVRASDCWQALEQRHGPLGWQRCRLSLHWSEAEADAALPLAERLRAQVPDSQLLPGRLSLPFGRVDGPVLAQALPLALEGAGVGRIEGQVERLEALPAAGWRLWLAAGDPLEANQVLLAAGPASSGLWPAASGTESLGMSWSGALELEAAVCRSDSLPAGAAEGILIPLLGQRQGLEARCLEQQQQDWIVDAGLAPRRGGWWLGQISVVAPGGAAQAAPEATWMEAELRRGLRASWPELAALPGRFVRVPVAFPGVHGPLFGPIAGAPGLWGLAGFSAAFSLLPVLAPDLASAMALAGLGLP